MAFGDFELKSEVSQCGGTFSISQTVNTLERVGVHLINSEPVCSLFGVPMCSHVRQCSTSATSNVQPANKYSIYRAIPIYNHDVSGTRMNTPQAHIFIIIIIIFPEVIKLIFDGF